MSSPQSQAIPLSAVISAMRSALGSLSDNPQIGHGQLMAATLGVLANTGVHIDARNNPLEFELIEAYQQLLMLGYIVPWPNSPRGPNPDWLHLTENGRQWTHSSNPIPEDVNGFMSALNALIPTLDPIIKLYISEAVVTYDRRAWLASAVMVGAASEKLVYMLLDSLRVVTGGKDGAAIEKAIKERNLPNMFEQIRKVVTSHTDSGILPYEVHEGCQPHLLSLFEAIRVQRNEAVHPTVGAVTPTTVRLTLSAFPSACRKVYDLIEWCQAGAKTP